jgi:hypothetical protein
MRARSICIALGTLALTLAGAAVFWQLTTPEAPRAQAKRERTTPVFLRSIPKVERSSPSRAAAPPSLVEPTVPHEPELPEATAEAPQPPDSAEQDKAKFEGFPESLEQRLERARERAELVGRWDGESKDAEWTRHELDRISTSLVRADLRYDQVQAVDCRETVCRFELKTTGETYGEVMQLIRTARGLDEQTWVRAEPDETPSTSTIEVFMPREGYRLSSGGGRIGEPVRVYDDPALSSG